MTSTAERNNRKSLTISLDNFVDVSFFLLLFSVYTNIFFDGHNNYFYFFAFFAFLGTTAIRLIFRIRQTGSVIVPPVTLWFGLFVLYGFASILWAHYPAASFHITSRILQCLIIQFCMAQNYSSKTALPRCLKIIVTASVMSSLYMLSQTSLENLFKNPFGSVSSSLNPNMFAVIYSFGAIIAFFFASHLHKRIAYPIAFYLTFMVLITGSRKSTITVLAALFLLSVLATNSRYWFLRLMLTLGVIVLVLYLIMTIPELYAVLGRRFDSMLGFFTNNEKDYSMTLRLTFLRVARQIFLENIFFGVGLANFPVVLGTVMNASTYAHNNYYELLADLGLVGFLIYYSYYIYVAVASLKRALLGSQYAKLMVTLVAAILLCDFGIVSFYTIQFNVIFTCATLFLSVCEIKQPSPLPAKKPVPIAD
ncbi:MAG: O-antigen ligase family protein [Clostridia bacterium]|nr:O-antigen ligase family protein [Clostridia bacterium]